MNPLIQLKTTPPLLIILTLLCFTPLPQVQATPDPGSVDPFNTADGDHALFSNTTGFANSAFGWYALFANTDGLYNTAVGAGALDLNNGNDNTAVGTAALLLNTTGDDNTAVGVAALENNTGDNNTATGAFALFSNTTGEDDTAIGAEALTSNTEGQINMAVGSLALSDNTTGIANTAVGQRALLSNTSGGNNTAIGHQALLFNTTGDNNTAMGKDALLNNSGSFNIALGGGAGLSLTTGDSNIDIGNAGVATESNTIRIGSTQTRAFIAGILGNGPFGCDVSIDAVTGQLGVGACISSERFKKDIESIDKASEAIFSLKPVTFHYKNDKTNIPQFGLIAEEVAKVNPALIAVDKEGKPYSVRYQQINAMLLNEFLKEHRELQELKKQVAALTAGLQKVNAQLEATKPAPQVVNNP